MTRYVIYAALLLASFAVPPLVFLLIGAFTYGWFIPRVGDWLYDRMPRKRSHSVTIRR